MIIGIIGGTGLMGSFLKKFFEQHNYKVLVSTRKTELKPEECAAKSDVVIISVPINVTVEVIKKVAPYVREDALLMDVTSLKVEPVKAMLKYSKSEVIGTHPVFGPWVNSIKGQTFVICPVRTKQWLGWLKGLLTNAGARIKVITPEEHDKLMSIIQGLTHFSAICVGYALKELNVDVEKSMELTSPIYKIRMDVVGRILNQDPGLYADIEILNPFTLQVINKFLNSVKQFYEIVKNKDRERFIKYFNEASTFFGRFKEDAMRRSNYLIKQLVKNENNNTRA